MEAKAYIVIENTTDGPRNYCGESRFAIRKVTKNKPSLYKNQAMFKICVTIPDNFFKESVPTVHIDVPATALEVEIEATAEVLPEEQPQ